MKSGLVADLDLGNPVVKYTQALATDHSGGEATHVANTDC